MSRVNDLPWHSTVAHTLSIGEVMGSILYPKRIKSLPNAAMSYARHEYNG